MPTDTDLDPPPSHAIADGWEPPYSYRSDPLACPKRLRIVAAVNTPRREERNRFGPLTLMPIVPLRNAETPTASTLDNSSFLAALHWQRDQGPNIKPHPARIPSTGFASSQP
jgi:hypothetical protein